MIRPPRWLLELAVLWREHLRRIALRQTDVVLLLLYALVVMPTALLGRLAGHHFLPIGRESEVPAWWPRRGVALSLDDLRRMH